MFDWPQNRASFYGYAQQNPNSNLDLSGKASLGETVMVSGIIGGLANLTMFHLFADTRDKTFAGYAAAAINGFVAGALVGALAPAAGMATSAFAAGTAVSRIIYAAIAYGFIGGFANLAGLFAGTGIGHLLNPEQFRATPDGKDMAWAFGLGALGGALFGQIKGAFSYPQARCGFIGKIGLWTRMTNTGRELFVYLVSGATVASSASAVYFFSDVLIPENLEVFNGNYTEIYEWGEVSDMLYDTINYAMRKTQAAPPDDY